MRTLPFCLRLPLILPLLVLSAACTPRGHPDDPAYGGFFKGIQNISDGTYDDRIATREQRVAALQVRQTRLLVERNSLQRRISTKQNELARLKHNIVVARVRLGNDSLDANTQAQIKTALNSRTTGDSDAARLANLQRTIENTRILAERLTKLAG